MNSSHWTAEALLSGSRLGATSVLLSNGRRRICVDTGMAHEAPLLVAALARRGLAPRDVPIVINTHFHIDHILNNSIFPGARIYASQQSYDWCRSLYSDLADNMRWEKLILKYYPETFDYERARELMGKLRKVGLRWWDLRRVGAPEQFVWIENHPLPEGIEGLVTSGHVPGHLSLVMRGEGEPVIVAGDAVLTRESDDQVLTMIPYNREQFRRDRAAILAMPGRILPGHDQEFENPACAAAL
ncbi:MAG TPA: MBL fold metallo-hydrolase [Terriglobia bacterium]|nr:MBL fold metallo-hydrolase [Terriglobia bacterium]